MQLIVKKFWEIALVECLNFKGKMDMSELFKRHFATLQKGTLVTVQNIKEDIKEVINKERRVKRGTLAFANRNIDANMSPYKTPVAKGTNETNFTTEAQKKPQKGSNDAVSKRLELLAKWKADKAKQKQLEKANKNPRFKVYHVDTNLMSNLENVNKMIKGKAIKKSQFAPANHVFKPPAGIEPIHFEVSHTHKKASENPSKPNTRKASAASRSSQAATSKAKSKSNEELEHSKSHKKITGLNTEQVMTRSRQEKCVKPLKISPVLTFSNIGVDVEDKTKTQACTSSNKQVSSCKKTNAKKNAENSVKTRKIDLKKKEGENVNKSRLKTPIKMEEKKEASAGIDDVFDGNNTPIYISPFVTISRGKQKARDEYKIRRSYGKENQLSFTPEKVNALAKHTSPQAGANYFMVKLDSEIDRINQMCQQWENCLQDPELPEEAHSSIIVAIGQSRLLVAKKFEQFRGLIVQCKTKQYKEKVVTCEDLHGFWDMVYMQVEDIDKRFSNLERLKQDNWTEMLIPEKKLPVQKIITRAKKANATSRLKDVIKAARQKQRAGDEEALNDACVEIRVPLQEQPIPQVEVTSATNKRQSERLLLHTQSRCSSSPGLTMMKITQSIKQGNGLTPATSILKSDRCRSTCKKSVAFRESSSPKSFRRTLVFDDKEKGDYVPSKSALNQEGKENLPFCLRRSTRLAK